MSAFLAAGQPLCLALDVIGVAVRSPAIARLMMLTTAPTQGSRVDKKIYCERKSLPSDCGCRRAANAGFVACDEMDVPEMAFGAGGRVFSGGA